MATRGGPLQQAVDANEWYWIMRVGHPLVDHVRARDFLKQNWWSPKDLTKAEIDALDAADLSVLAFSPSLNARLAAASHPLSPAQVLDRLSQDSEFEVRKAVGHNRATPGATLAKMHREYLKRTNYREGENDEISSYRLEWLWLEVDDPTFPVDFDKALEVIQRHGSDGLDDRILLAKKERLSTDLRRRLASWYDIEGEVAALLVDDPALEVREALAGNVSSDWDPSIANRLASDLAAEVRMASAARWATAALLAQLAEDDDPDVRIAAASNARLPRGSLLQLLADDDLEVREQVVLHGALTYDDLHHLDGQDDYRPLLHAKLKYDKWPACWGEEHLYGIGDSEWDAERKRVATVKAEESKQFLRALARSPHASTRLAVARNTGTPEDALEMLANDADADVQNAVYEILGTETTYSYGYYSETPIWWYRREQLDVVALSKSTNPRVRALMAGRLHQIAGDELHALARDDDPAVRAAAAKNPRIAFSDLVALCDDRDETVRKAAASEIARGLKEYESSREQEHQRNWLTDAHRLPQPLKDLVYSSTQVRGVDHRARQFHVGLGTGSWTGWSLSADLASLATVKNPVARAAIASYSGPTEGGWSSYHPVGPEVLRLLAEDPDESVRTAAFSNSSGSAARLVADSGTSSEVLLGFSKSGSSTIRAGVAANPSTPAAALANLVRDRDVIVRVAVAGNESTPQEALEVLTADPEDSVLLSLLGNPRAPIRFIEAQADRLADWAGARWMERIAGNPSSPEAVLRKIAYSPSTDVRALVATNANTPPDTLAILAQDESPRVRSAVERRHS